MIKFVFLLLNTYICSSQTKEKYTYIYHSKDS